jgi:hypothetical protein
VIEVLIFKFTEEEKERPLRAFIEERNGVF